MTGIENYPYTILFNLSGDRPEPVSYTHLFWEEVMIKAIMKIHTTSSTVTFVCGDVAIIGNGEFRASSGKVDGFIPVSYTHLSVAALPLAG